LPENVRVIGPEESLNSYALVSLLDAATVYTSKIGFELAYRGIPVVVAGMAFYRNRGFTFDASSPEEYFDYLSDVARLKAIHECEGYSDMAMRFSYFFFQKYIDVSFVRWKFQKHLALNIESLAEIMPGANHSMDTICDMVLNDRPTYLTLEEGDLLYAENQVAALTV
jgi:capsule polysaccharide export protein KpsC/LpsZ